MNKKDNSTAVGCITVVGFLLYVALVQQIASSGSTAGVIIAIILIISPIVGFVIWMNSGTFRVKKAKRDAKKAAKKSSSPKYIYQSYKDDRPKYGVHTLAKNNRDEIVYNSLIKLISLEILRMESDLLKKEKSDNENLVGKRFYQTNLKFIETTRPQMEKIDLRLMEIAESSEKIANEVTKLSEESESLRLLIANKSTIPFLELESKYSAWKSSAKIEGKPPIYELTSFKYFEKDYKLITAKAKPIVMNIGDYCFCCFSSVVILFNRDGYFLDAFTPKCISADESFSSAQYTSQKPSDSTVTTYTWTYPRVDGGPDRRYNYNYRIFITKVANIHISIAGRKLEYSVSNLKNNTEFVSAIKAYSSRSFSIIKPVPVELVNTKSASFIESEDRKKQEEIDKIIKEKYT